VGIMLKDRAGRASVLMASQRARMPIHDKSENNGKKVKNKDHNKAIRIIGNGKVD
jgi:hypothetical protein